MFLTEVIRYDRPYYEDTEELAQVRKLRSAGVRWIAFTWRSQETLGWLKSAATSDSGQIVRQAAVQGLARGWKSEPETLPWLKDRARSDEDWHVRQAAVRELARGWKSEPETLPLLKDCIRSAPPDTPSWQLDELKSHLDDGRAQKP